MGKDSEASGVSSLFLWKGGIVEEQYCVRCGSRRKSIMSGMAAGGDGIMFGVATEINGIMSGVSAEEKA